MQEPIPMEKLWSEYQGAIRRFLQSKVNDSADVDDLLQDILLKSFHHLHHLKSQNSIKSWLFQIASHAIADFYRQRALQERTKQGKYEQEQTNEHGFSHDTEAVRQELSQCIRPFIQTLPKAQAELLEQIEIQGVSQKQYAEQLGIGYSTLKSRVQKGRQLLKQRFESCCVFTFDHRGNIMDCDAKSDQCSDC